MSGVVVADASALVLAVTDDTGAGEAARSSLHGRIPLAPHVVDAEVGNALRRLVLRRVLGEREGALARRRAAALVRRRYAVGSALGERAWELHRTLGFYDALYGALAEELDCPLVTADARLTAPSGLRCRFELLPA